MKTNAPFHSPICGGRGGGGDKNIGEFDCNRMRQEELPLDAKSLIYYCPTDDGTLIIKQRP